MKERVLGWSIAETISTGGRRKPRFNWLNGRDKYFSIYADAKNEQVVTFQKSEEQEIRSVSYDISAQKNPPKRY
jgi:hypothetical protein